MKLNIAGFDWDRANRTKCQKHGIGIEEIESLFKQDNVLVAPDISHSSHEIRYIAVGRGTNNRPVFVAFTLRGAYIRPISARYMHTKEIKQYEKITPATE